MKTILITLLIFAPSAMAANLDRNIDTYRVFGTEHPGVYKHPAAITELSNGDLYIAYYGGAGEYDQGTAVYGSRIAGSPNQWMRPEIIADTPMRGDGNPVVWQAPDGILWLFYNTQYGPSWSEARVKGKISKNGGLSWSDSFMVAFEQGSMVRGKPIALKNGDFLLPMYDEKGSDREELDTSTSSFFLRYSKAFKTWAPTNKIKSPTGNLQPQVVQITDKHLICFMRRGGGYGPNEKGFIQKSESRDGGFTWSDAVETDLKNPNSAVDVIRLKNGDIVLVYNPSDNDRTPLRVSMSKDDGKTFNIHRDIGGGDNTYAYPYLIQTKDEKLHVIYTTNNRTTIMHAVFKVDAIGPEPSDD